MTVRHHLTRAVVVGAAVAAAAFASTIPEGNATPGAQRSARSAHASPPRPARARAGGRHSVRLSAVGDTILGNTPALPSSPGSYLDAVKRAIRWTAQIRFANLEGTLTDASGGKCGGSNGGTCFEFRNPPHYARYFHRAGFTVLNDANNHSHDFGQAGLDQTIRTIHRHGMKQTGLPGEVTVTHAGSTPVAFVAFAPYPNTADLLDLHAAKALIRKARSRARVVVVYMHAGAEGADADHVTGREEIFAGEDRGNPEKFAHMAIRNGAGLVIASGPHVVRGMQFYRHRLIAYSLGNFANFHNFASGGILSESSILHVTLSRSGRFDSARLLSVRLDGEGHPSLGGGTVSLVRRLSREDFGSTRARFGSRGVIHPPARSDG
jgi:poly-gamma-glutamate capsule biosynthesis protein CapA/YwtB (metallophosphatase superfamily)